MATDTMNLMAQVPVTHPLMKAWTAYQESDDFKNSYKWITSDKNYPTMETYHSYVNGSLWAVFMAGFNAATERAASLHESVNPASDDERLHHVPGAGGMGAVIQYRDLIRSAR